MVNLQHYNPLTERVIAAAMEVHSKLGPGFPESVYQKAMEHELSLREVPFTSQQSFNVHYKDIIAGRFIPDLLCNDCLIVELKALENVKYEVIQATIINYLLASELEVGLMLNFGKTSLEIKRYLIPEKFQ